MNETTSQAQVPSCPHCGSKEFFRSRRSGIKDWLLRHVLSQKAYRCATCDERFYRVSHGHYHGENLHHQV